MKGHMLQCRVEKKSKIFQEKGASKIKMTERKPKLSRHIRLNPTNIALLLQEIT